MYSVPAYVEFRSIEAEGVLMDRRTDQFLGLNETGAAIWRALAAGKSLTATAADLTAMTGVSPEVAVRESAAFVDELVGRGLLERVLG